jgi:biotin carboxylase
VRDRLLVTGGAIGDIEIIAAAKDLGYFVITSGNRPNDPGHTFSDKYIPCDYTDTQGLIAICKENKIGVIVPSAHDLAATAAAEVAQELGLPGYDAPSISRQIHDKSELRKLWLSLGGRVPRFVSSSNVFVSFFKSIRLKFPVIVKPTNLTGGAGISISKNRVSLVVSILTAYFQPGSQGVVVEEFLEGTNHGLTCLLKNKKIVFFANDDEFHIYDRFRVSATTFPSTHDGLRISPLIEEIENFAREMELVDGIFHTQYLMTESGPVLLEACRRTPGDAYTKFVSLAFSFDYSSDIVLGFAGKPPIQYKKSISRDKGFSVGRFILMPTQEGIFDHVENPQLSKMLWMSDFRHSGQIIENSRSWTAKIYIFESETEKLDEQYYRKLATESRVFIK